MRQFGNAVMWQCGNLRMRQCGNVGRRAMRCGAPAVTPSVSAQAGNARPRFHHCRIAALPHCRIATLPH